VVLLLAGQLRFLAGLLLGVFLLGSHDKLQHVPHHIQVPVYAGRPARFESLAAEGILGEGEGEGFDEGGEVELEGLGQLAEVLPVLCGLCFECFQVQVEQVHVLKVMVLLESFPFLAQLSDAIYLTLGVLLFLAVFSMSIIMAEL
jgi:hypothetical protein